MMKVVDNIKYMRQYKGLKGIKYRFSPPSYVVRLVAKNSDGAIKLKSRTFDDFEQAKRECKTIYETQITPYLRRSQSGQAVDCPQSLKNIWAKFCERRGIDCEYKGNNIIDPELAEQTKKDYKRCYGHISDVKGKNGTLFVEVNLDYVSPQFAEYVYMKLYGICKERWSRNCIDLIRTLFNFGKHKLGILHSENPFQKLNIRKSRRKPVLWTEEDVHTFNKRAIELGDPEVGLAVRLNWWLSQRPSDFFNIDMSQCKEMDGFHYFHLMPNKTVRHAIESFPVIPPDLYEEIKGRTGRLIHFNSIRTFTTHFLAVKNTCGIDRRLNFQSLRNSSNTKFFDAGGTETEAMSILGHKNRSTTAEIYRQNTPRQSINAAKKRLEMEGKDNAIFVK